MMMKIEEEQTNPLVISSGCDDDVAACVRLYETIKRLILMITDKRDWLQGV